MRAAPTHTRVPTRTHAHIRAPTRTHCRPAPRPPQPAAALCHNAAFIRKIPEITAQIHPKIPLSRARGSSGGSTGGPSSPPKCSATRPVLWRSRRTRARCFGACSRSAACSTAGCGAGNARDPCVALRCAVLCCFCGRIRLGGWLIVCCAATRRGWIVRRCFPEPSGPALAASSDRAQSFLDRAPVAAPYDPPPPTPAPALAPTPGGLPSPSLAVAVTVSEAAKERDRPLPWEQVTIWWDDARFDFVDGGGFRWQVSDDGTHALENPDGDPRGVHWVPLTWVVLRWRLGGQLAAFCNTHYPVGTPTQRPPTSPHPPTRTPTRTLPPAQSGFFPMSFRRGNKRVYDGEIPTAQALSKSCLTRACFSFLSFFSP